MRSIKVQLINRHAKTGTNYTLKWLDPNTNRYTTQTLGVIPAREAKQKQRDKQTEINQYLYSVSGDAGKEQENHAPLFSELIPLYNAWFRTEHKSWKESERKISKILIPLCGKYPADSIPPKVIKDYIAKRKLQRNVNFAKTDGKQHLTVKPSTVKKDLEKLMSVLNWAVYNEFISHNPLKGKVKAPGKKEIRMRETKRTFFRPEQVPAILERIKTKYVLSDGERWAATYALAMNTGMRRGELMRLKKEHLEPTQIVVFSSEDNLEDTTKNGTERRIPRTDKINEILEILIPLADKKGFLCPRCCPRHFTRKFNNVLRELGIKGTLHSTRHTFGTMARVHKVDKENVQAALGHFTPDMTDNYTHMAEEYLAEQFKGFAVG